MKIYFAGSISGGRADVHLYKEIIKHHKNHGIVLSEFVGDASLTALGEDGLNDEHIHKRDLEMILESDIIVAEVSTPSLGVGYEIGRAIQHNKKILCLHRPQDGKRLSAMIAGNPHVILKKYNNINEAKQIIDEFFGKKVGRERKIL